MLTNSLLAALSLLPVAPGVPSTALPSAQPALALAIWGGGGSGACTNTNLAARRAAYQSARGEFWLTLGKCINFSDLGDRLECLEEAFESLLEENELIAEQFEARMALCAELGEDRYDPEVEPEDFVSLIDNPYLPYIPGTTMIYEADTEEGLEVITVEVLSETREVQGVVCTVVHDVVTLDGVLVEDTFDWYAQDTEGNVWYFGELSFEYEDGVLAGLDGSWEAGEDGAKAGIVMHAAPTVGPIYRQEFLLGEAEDVARVFEADVSVTVEAGTFDDCLETEETTPLEPEVLEHKFYAPGVGVVKELNLETGETAELVQVLFN